MGAVSPPWPRRQEFYGSEETYIMAADWLAPCATVADWGGAGGYFGRFLPASCAYTVIDGTYQGNKGTVLANLREYHGESDGILLRHVVDNTLDWRAVLRNAVAAFQKRLAVVTFTPDVETTTMIDKRWGPGKRPGYPYWHFNPDDLRREMEPWLVLECSLQTTHPERVYYLERK
jgi:hypothetical protein